jgi:hypothetical protein
MTRHLHACISCLYGLLVVELGHATESRVLILRQADFEDAITYGLQRFSVDSPPVYEALSYGVLSHRGKSNHERNQYLSIIAVIFIWK